MSHIGARLLADLVDRTTLIAQLSAVFAGRTAPQTAHDPGRVLIDVAVMRADGGDCISDTATLARPGRGVRSGGLGLDLLAGSWMRSTMTIFCGIAASRAAGPPVAWAQRAEAR